MAAHSMTGVKPFEETFHLLHDKYRMKKRQAFTTTLRPYRGGCLTKDIIYLRGLWDLLKYLGAGHDIEPLYVGKIGPHYVPYVQELNVELVAFRLCSTIGNSTIEERVPVSPTDNLPAML